MTVVSITGHQNIPQNAVPEIKASIRQLLETASHPLIGISSLAAGADQLFAETILELGGQLEVLIPSEKYETTFTNAEDKHRFQQLLSSATRITTMPFPEPSEDAFLQAGRRLVDDADLLIAVWDGEPAQGKGGTADIVNYASSRSLPVKIAWPKGLKR